MLCSHTHTPAQTGTHTQTHALLTYTHTSTDRHAHTNTCSAHIHTHQHRQACTHTNTYTHKPFETFPLFHICPSLEQGQTKVKDRRTALEQTEPKQTSKVYYLCHSSATPTVYSYTHNFILCVRTLYCTNVCLYYMSILQFCMHILACELQ